MNEGKRHKTLVFKPANLAAWLEDEREATLDRLSDSIRKGRDEAKHMPQPKKVRLRLATPDNALLSVFDETFATKPDNLSLPRVKVKSVHKGVADAAPVQPIYKLVKMDGRDKGDDGYRLHDVSPSHRAKQVLTPNADKPKVVTPRPDSPFKRARSMPLIVVRKG